MAEQGEVKTRRHFTNPNEIAEVGEKIYEAKYQADYEESRLGQFVVIDVKTEKSYVAPQPEEALEKAKSDSSDGLFHLIRIGATGAFRVSYSSSENDSWLY